MYPCSMTLAFSTTAHAGDRSFERNIDATLAKHVIDHGSQTLQPNGLIMHIARDPKNIDHVIKVVTTPHPKTLVTAIRDTSHPYQESVLSQTQHAKEEADAKEKVNRSRANKKAQLKKKRERTPPPNNKPKK